MRVVPPSNESGKRVMAGRDSASPAYQVAMMVLCIYAIGVLAVRSLVRLNPQVDALLEYADNGVCVLFFADFLWSLWRAGNRWRYLATWGWLDLLSSIPALDAARWGRLARVVRVFRILRGLRATRVLTTALLRHRAQNTFLAATLVALLLIVFCATAILHIETDAQSNIRTAEDALWWAVTTVTTVGYGDRYPVTSEGRVIAVILMSAGVGLFGTLSGFLAAWFLSPATARAMPAEESDIAQLRREIAKLREVMESHR